MNGRWTIVLDSKKGFATPDNDKTIDRVLGRFDDSEDVAHGVSKDGVLTLSIDVSADTFDDAVRRAILRVRELFRAEGVAFPLDEDLVPHHDTEA